MWKKELAEALRAKLHDARAKNKNVSMRWLAKEVGLSSGALSEILSGKRVPTQANALKILPLLNLPAREQARLAYLITGEAKLKRRELSSEEFEVFREWSVRTVFVLCGRAGGCDSRSLNFSKFGLETNTAISALRKLAALGLVRETQAGVFERPPEQVATSDGLPSQAVQAMHLSDLDLLRYSVGHRQVTDRFLNSLVFNCRRDDLPAIRKELAQFLSRMQLLFEVPEGDGVCFAGVSMVDLTEVLNE